MVDATRQQGLAFEHKSILASRRRPDITGLWLVRSSVLVVEFSEMSPFIYCSIHRLLFVCCCGKSGVTFQAFVSFTLNTFLCISIAYLCCYSISTIFTYLILIYLFRVATNLENLEYSGISLNTENLGNSVQPQGKIVTNKVFLLCLSNICVKQLLKSLVNFWQGQNAVVTCYIAGVDVEYPLTKVIITLTFCCDNLRQSKFVAMEKPGKLWEFLSPTLWPPFCCLCVAVVRILQAVNTANFDNSVSSYCTTFTGSSILQTFHVQN